MRLADSMRDVLGLRPGDRFAVLAANSHEYIELYHAAMFGAGIINPLNIRFAPSELAYALNDSGSKVVFTDASFSTLLNQARDHGAMVDTVVMIDGESDRGASGVSGGVLGYEDVLAVGRPIMPPEPDEDDAAVLMYTGGTTGFPKGVVLQQRAEVLNVYHVLAALGLREERRFLFQSPMFHAALVAGVLGIPASGATSVTIPLFEAELVLPRHRRTGNRHHHGGPDHVVDARTGRGFLPKASALSPSAGLRSGPDIGGSHYSMAGDAPGH